MSDENLVGKSFSQRLKDELVAYTWEMTAAEDAAAHEPKVLTADNLLGEDFYKSDFQESGKEFQTEAAIESVELVSSPIEAADATDLPQAELVFIFSLICQGVFRKDRISFKCARGNYCDLLTTVAEDYLGLRYSLKQQKTQNIITFASETEVLKLQNLLEDYFDFDTVRGHVGATPAEFSTLEKAVILRTAFLTAGSMAKPGQSYQIEFTLKRPSVNNFIVETAKDLNLSLNSGKNNNLYIKSGDDIAKFLALTGAHKSLLKFENIRVEKQVNEQVNRVVNFDSANTQRVADSAARQIAVIKQLIDNDAYDLLPENLREVADLRLENPGFSLQEIGELMNPPISKSGVYHRLKNMEQWAESFFQEERPRRAQSDSRK